MTKLTRYAWLVVGWNLLTILGGAVVRATGSGAGCGRSWPTCQGTMIPELRGATAIEFVHRAASGIALTSVVVLVAWVFRALPTGHKARKGGVWSLVAIIGEALIGALIVFSEWVAEDASVARAVAVPMHLVNTLLLLAALTLTAFWLRHGSLGLDYSKDRLGFLLGAAGMVTVAGTGAVTALADTLFPKEGFALGSFLSVGDSEHFLTQLRVIHPLVAVLLACGMAVWVGRRWPAHPVGRVVMTIVALQVGLGFANIVTGTLLAVSLAHLLAADVLWIAWIWLAAEVMSGLARRTESTATTPSVSSGAG